MKKNNVIKILIFLFFVCLPILDILRSTPIKDVEFLGIALIELVNFVFIGFAFLLTLTKVDKKKLIMLFIYFAILGVYLGLHYNNMMHFDTNIFPKATFNFITESYYILRVYCLPVLLLFVLVNNSDVFDKKFYSFVVKYIVLFISLNLIVLNIFKLSYCSYGEDGKFVTNSILEIFNYEGDYKYLLTRGLFNSANELSAVLFSLLPLNVYLLFKEQKKLNIFMLFSQMLAMIILGTRTSAIGSILIPCVAIAIYLFMLFIKKEKLNKKFIISLSALTILMFGAFIISPYRKYRESLVIPDRLKTNNSSEINKMQEDYTDTDELVKALYGRLYFFGINEEIIAVYPAEYDSEFWIKICERDLYINNDSRIMKNDIAARIKERNNRKMDSLFGLGYTLNLQDMERDYCYQYYLFGLVGIIVLMGTYFIFYFKKVFEFFKDFKNKFIFSNIILFMPNALCFVIAYFSGHVFGWVTPMMIIVFSLAFLNMGMRDLND